MIKLFLDPETESHNQIGLQRRTTLIGPMTKCNNFLSSVPTAEYLNSSNSIYQLLFCIKAIHVARPKSMWSENHGDKPVI